MDQGFINVDNIMSTSRRRLYRRLGRLETMYHIYYTRGIDIYAQMATLICEKAVRICEVQDAMRCLLKRHPMLRMTIKETKENERDMPDFKFVEMNPVKLDIRVSNTQDRESLLNDESCNSFSLTEGPLWRMTISNGCDTESDVVSKLISSNSPRNEFCFVFTFHHSLADGMYLRILFADFLEFLDMTQRHIISPEEVKQIDMLPCIEHFLPMLRPKSRIIPSECSVVEECKSLEALQAYETNFRHEINFLRNKRQGTNTLRSCIQRSKTGRFLIQCKQHNVTVTGACVAAACISFGELVKASIPEQITVLNIPVEVMVNMRRYTSQSKIYQAYPGVAALHLPITIKLPIRENLHSDEHFWYLAKQCTDDIHNLLVSQWPLEYMSTEIEEEIHSKPHVGKSPYVLCVTNMASVDGIVKPEQKSRFQLKNFPAMTQIGVDDMPIFYVGILSIAKELHLDIGHCTRYTSQETAAKFTWNILSSLQKLSTM